MFRNSVPSMSYPVFLDLVVTERLACLTSYVEIEEHIYEADGDPGDDQVEEIRSLQFNGSFAPGESPLQPLVSITAGCLVCNWVSRCSKVKSLLCI